MGAWRKSGVLGIGEWKLNIATVLTEQGMVGVSRNKLWGYEVEVGRM